LRIERSYGLDGGEQVEEWKLGADVEAPLSSQSENLAQPVALPGSAHPPFKSPLCARQDEKARRETLIYDTPLNVMNWGFSRVLGTSVRNRFCERHLISTYRKGYETLPDATLTGNYT